MTALVKLGGAWLAVPAAQRRHRDIDADRAAFPAVFGGVDPEGEIEEIPVYRPPVACFDCGRVLFDVTTGHGDGTALLLANGCEAYQCRSCARQHDGLSPALANELERLAS